MAAESRRRGMASAGRRVMAGAGAPPLGEEEENPFRVPTDEEVLRLREQDRAERDNRRQQMQRMPVWDKVPDASRSGRIRRLREEDVPVTDEAAKERIRRTQRLVSAATEAMGGGQRRERENMSNFVAKKREMFLLQMALDTKREEIQKLERKAQLKEEALKKSELMLEEDAIRFDAFLKENDKEAYAALKQAEAETKAKQDKLQEIKRLKHTLNSLTAQMTKLSENLDEYKSYRDFLERLTPEEWHEARLEEKRQRQEQRRLARFRERKREWDVLRVEKRREVEADVEAARQRALREGRQPKKVDVERRTLSLLPPEPREEDEPASSSGEELPMYFARPEQLLDLFTEKEESNLFLITQNQVTDQQLEELRAQFRETEDRMEVQTSALNANLMALRTQIDEEVKKADELGRRVTQTQGDQAQEEMLRRIGEKISEVYEQCIGDVTSKPSRIGMLTKLEGRLEELMATIQQLPEEYVEQMEKELERRRRKARLEERKRLEAEKQAERLRISMKRSEEPVRRRQGRPLMFRSRPAPKKKKKEKPDPAKLKELEDMKYLT